MNFKKKMLARGRGEGRRLAVVTDVPTPPDILGNRNFTQETKKEGLVMSRADKVLEGKTMVLLVSVVTPECTGRKSWRDSLFCVATLGFCLGVYLTLLGEPIGYFGVGTIFVSGAVIGWLVLLFFAEHGIEHGLKYVLLHWLFTDNLEIKIIDTTDTGSGEINDNVK